MAEITPNPKLAAELAKRAERGLKQAAKHIDRVLGEKLTNSPPRTGRAYEKRLSAKGNNYLAPVPDAATASLPGALAYTKQRHSRRLSIHIASAPGEPPALLWGLLRSSRGWRIVPTADGDQKAEFGTQAPYARRLEKDMNRPAWLSTLREEFPEAQRLVAAEMARG